MKKSNILVIILSFITGLVVCGVAMLSVMIYRDFQADKDNNNSKVNLQSTSSNYDKQNIEEKNNQVDLQQNEETKVTEEENKVEDTVGITQEVNTVENTVPVSATQNTKRSDNSTVTTTTQSKSNSTSSGTNTSFATKSTNTNQTAIQNNNKSSTYIVNKNTKKFHIPSCRSVNQMKDSNKMTFNGTRDEAISRGYKPCGNCNP